MLKSQIEPGIEYAVREKRVVGSPLQRVRIIEHIRGNKWRAKWIDPNPGLVDYIESGQLVVPWKEHKKFLKDEENTERLRQHNERQGYKGDSPLVRALEEVFGSVGEQNIQFASGSLRGSPEVIGRVKVRAGMDPKQNSPWGYVDRNRTVYLPFDEAQDLARKFSAAEPATVLVGVEATEREWSQKARNPGDEYIVPLLNEYRAAWALVRQWAGMDAAVAQREAEILRLGKLVWDAIYALQKAGLDREAARFRRAFEAK